MDIFPSPVLGHGGRMSTLPITPRTQLHRKPGRGMYDRAAIHAILDEALVCHIAVCMPEHAAPVVLPTAHVRVGDQIYVHGARSNGLLRALAAGVEFSLAVTLVDALVLSRVALHHSVNYRSVVAFGRGAAVEDDVRKRHVLDALLDKVSPGRAAACRAPDDAELAATLVVALPLAEASAKIRRGPPLADTGSDAALPYWAGIIPLVTSHAPPERAPDCNAALPANLAS